MNLVSELAPLHRGGSDAEALASYVVGEWVSNWWADVAVWEEKIRRQRPGLLRGDGPIPRGRAWYNQFYSESSSEVFKNQNFDW